MFKLVSNIHNKSKELEHSFKDREKRVLSKRASIKQNMRLSEKSFNRQNEKILEQLNKVKID